MWPYAHNWSAAYVVTYRFKTEILVSRSGREQRRALRPQPRRTIQTAVLRAGDDEWLWTTGADVFEHTDPVDGRVSLVRLPDQVEVDRPNSAVMLATPTLSVEPGTDTFPAAEGDARAAYRQRYVLPFYVNWRDGVSDTLGIPRQTVDFDAGRIAVSRPVAFNSRTTGLAFLRDNRQIEAVVDFFRWARGRQRDFWIPAAIDMTLLETVSDTTVTVAGAAPFDAVNIALRFEMTNGFVFYRTVTAAGTVGGTTLLGIDDEPPMETTPETVRRLSWMRLGRFASDDLSVEWITNTVGQSLVQFTTLPYGPPDTPLFDSDTSDAVDYYGSFYGYDPLQIPVNNILPLASEWPPQ